LVAISKRAGQRKNPELDLKLASPLVGAERPKGTGTFDHSRNRFFYNVPLLNGDDEDVSIRDGAKQSKQGFIRRAFRRHKPLA
jgi:hypothetical protein